MALWSTRTEGGELSLVRRDDKRLLGHDLDARFDTTHATSPQFYMGANSRLKALYTRLTSPKTTARSSS
jgi:hypothetical protein